LSHAIIKHLFSMLIFHAMLLLMPFRCRFLHAATLIATPSRYAADFAAFAAYAIISSSFARYAISLSFSFISLSLFAFISYFFHAIISTAADAIDNIFISR